MVNAILALLPALLLALAGVSSAEYDSSWHTGRATHYGGAGDPWNIHMGEFTSRKRNRAQR